MLPTEAHALRIRLHREGLSDREIAERLGVGRTAITNWRVLNGFPSNIASTHPGSVRLTERLALYRAGLNDMQIATEQGVHFSSVWHWRRKLGLPSTRPRSDADLSETVRDLHARGLSDSRISRILFKSRGFGGYWRRKMGLPRNYEPLHSRRADGSRMRPARNSLRIASVADVSLDALDAFGRAKIDSLRDDSWSDWLEEMGATVW